MQSPLEDLQEQGALGPGEPITVYKRAAGEPWVAQVGIVTASGSTPDDALVALAEKIADPPNTVR